MGFNFLRSSLLTSTQDIHTNLERDKHVDDCDDDLNAGDNIPDNDYE